MVSDPIKSSRASLAILSPTLSVDEIVRAVALIPDWSAEKGTPIPGEAGNRHRYTAVAFESHLDAEADPAAHIDDLLSRVMPAKKAISALADATRAPGARGVPVRLSLYVESSRRMLGIDVSANQLAAMRELGAHFGVEVDTDCEAIPHAEPALGRSPDR
jgi:Domain of unknown function (DUF4279)